MRHFPHMRLHIRGYEFLHRRSAGDLCLVSYHPRGSSTWHWAVTLARPLNNRTYRAARRTGQWHDHYWLPFGFCLLVSRQDYHLSPTPAQSERIDDDATK